jgi:hypothetical protein
MINIKSFISYVLKSKLIIVGFILYFLFNASALSKNHFMDFFFFGSSIHHCCQGLDFYQIPNGAYAFVHGGGLDGTLPPGLVQYSQNYVTNYNVYHPLLTVILGSIFILFNPEISIRLWIVVKIFITLFAVYYIYKNFHGNKFLDFAIFLFLINFSQYNDIKISQYQYLFNLTLLFLLINLVKNKNQVEGGILYFLSLVAKPVGLLFAPILVVKKKWTLLFCGLSLFLISTLTFKFLGSADYYINNIVYHLLTPIPTKGIDFLSLDALLRNGFGFTPQSVKIIRMTFLLGIYALSLSKKVSVVKLFFFLTIYFLFFYDLVFQYHFSIFGPLLCICVLSLPEFQTKIARVLSLIICLPNLFFLFRIFHVGIITNPLLGTDPTLSTWRDVSFFQILPITLLAVIVLIPEMKYYLKIGKSHAE